MPEYYDIYSEKSVDVFDRDTDWKEDADAESSCEISLTTDGTSHAVMRGTVAANKLRSFAQYALGYAYAENPGSAPPGGWPPGTKFKMFRSNPPTFPKLPFLRVKSVNWHEHCVKAGTLPTAEEMATGIAPANVWPAPGDTHETKVFKMRSMYARNAGQNFGGGEAIEDDNWFIPFCDWTTRYEKARVTVDFYQPRYPLYEDLDPAFDPEDESGRNVYWTTEPSIDLIALEGGTNSQLFWRERLTADTSTVLATNIPAANLGAVLPADATRFPAPLGYLDPKLMDVGNWIQVPTRYIFNENLIPDKILSVLGKTNKSEWYGYEPGTALFIGASFEPFPWPIYSTSTRVVQLWNVKYHFKYYDPVRAAAADVTPAPVATPKRGWKIFRNQTGFSFWATRYNDKDLYDEEEFSKLFEHREST